MGGDYFTRVTPGSHKSIKIKNEEDLGSVLTITELPSHRFSVTQLKKLPVGGEKTLRVKKCLSQEHNTIIFLDNA